MIIKETINNQTLPQEGNYIAKVASVKVKPNEQAPKKLIVGFKIENHEKEILKEVPYSFNEGTPLRKDVETILASEFTKAKITQGFDLDELIGKPCGVVVMHKAAAGGKSVAVVGLVLPATGTAQNPVTN